MMITPQIQYSTRDSYREAYNSGWRKSHQLYAYFKTYRELKKNIKSYLLEAHCPEDDENTVFVVRSKYDGGWGSYAEYCEHWAMRNGKPTIIGEGWS